MTWVCVDMVCLVDLVPWPAVVISQVSPFALQATPRELQDWLIIEMSGFYSDLETKTKRTGCRQLYSRCETGEKRVQLELPRWPSFVGSLRYSAAPAVLLAPGVEQPRRDLLIARWHHHNIDLDMRLGVIDV